MLNVCIVLNQQLYNIQIAWWDNIWNKNSEILKESWNELNPKLPLKAAQINGVSPFLSVLSTIEPFSSNNLAVPT